MSAFASFSDLRATCLDLPGGHLAAAAVAANREAHLTKPPRSLGRLEDLVAWLAHWQGRNPPRLEHVDILIFAGNHGVTAQGVSAYPAEVTVQMVANFAAGGAAINQLARTADANLRVIPLSLDVPTADFTQQPALTETEFLAAVAEGCDAVSPEADLVCLVHSASLTLIATRSMPTVSCRPASVATLSFVPTPSVQATSTGSSYLRAKSGLLKSS